MIGTETSVTFLVITWELQEKLGLPRLMRHFWIYQTAGKFLVLLNLGYQKLALDNGLVINGLRGYKKPATQLAALNTLAEKPLEMRGKSCGHMSWHRRSAS